MVVGGISRLNSLRTVAGSVVLLALFIATCDGTSFGARGGHTHAASSPAPQAAVINLTVIPAQRAARTVSILFPHDRVRFDASANAIVVVGPPDDLAQIRSVVQGIDVRNPSTPQTDVIPLRVLKPTALIARLHPLYPGAHLEAGSKNSLLVRAAPQDLTDIKAVINTLDTAPPTIAPSDPPAEAIRVNMADPKTIARALARQVNGLRASVSGSSVILVGSADQIEKAKTLAQTMDAPGYGAHYTQIYRLHNIDATSVGDLIARSFPNVRVTVDKDLNAISVLGTAAEQRRIADAIAQLDVSASPGNGSNSSAEAAYGNGNIDVVDLQSAMPGLNGAPSTSANDIASAVQQALQQIAPDLHITVPSNSTEIVLAGSPQSIRLAKDLIARLDREKPLVVLDTEVLEVDENVARNLGLSLPSAVIGSTFQEIQPTPDPFGQPGKIMRFQGITRSPLQFQIALNLLVQNGDARVLADPRVTTISGNTASIRAGDSIAILTQTGGGVGTPVTQQLQTFSTGVTLDITPVVGPTGNITVALHPVVNSLEGLVNGIPQIATRDTQTVVQLHDNQTLVIGGLIQETSQHSVSKIPVLGELPLVGKLFQNGDTEYQRNELVIVVTPHIIKPGQALPAPAATLPIPTPRPLPTLPPGTVLPSAESRPAPHPEPSPVDVPTPMGSPATMSSAGSSSPPAPTPSAFSNANVFSYGLAPANTYARDTDPPQIFFLQFSPTVLRNGTPVQIFAITTSNVNRVTVGYSGYTVSLAQTSTAKWEGQYNFNASGLVANQTTVRLTLTAYRNDGATTSVNIPVSLLSN